MIKNVGTIDKVLRVVLGVGILSLLFVLEGNQRWLGLIGLVPLATVALSWCPLYTLIGVKTNKGQAA